MIDFSKFKLKNVDNRVAKLIFLIVLCVPLCAVFANTFIADLVTIVWGMIGWYVAITAIDSLNIKKSSVKQEVIIKENKGESLE